MKTSLRNICLWLLGWLPLLPALAQTQSPAWSLAYTLPAKGNSLLSIDRFDRLYLSDARQNIIQLDTLGKVINTFSPPIQGRVAMAEAWSPAKITVFYEDRQRVQLLDRFLTPLGLADLREYTQGTIRAATLAADDRLWLFDETTFRLLKIDTRVNQIVYENPLELLLARQQQDVTFLREYQNKLYMVDRLSGIFVFDNMGNYQKKIALPNLTYVGFLGDELYYLSGNQLHFQHLYNFKTRTVALPDQAPPYRQVLAGDKFLYLTTQDALYAYRWQ
ncbi:hypothetical protein TH63_02445 [Rufibacter radiotolerans]|uniref:Uncharacterized protein n=1 Tax=Rufibacter radiotolerans TaxID=1379910 RepID=A0A0H4VGL1_9BACT|nr:hypothetical protein [Rufibacter radiotolerans]AKQ44740.1 hypothetical protein TH63_02445 [Rufibacter radiotolerans]